MYAVQITGERTGFIYTLLGRYATLTEAEAAIERLRRAQGPTARFIRKAVASS